MILRNTRTSARTGGYALPSILIISTALMIISTAVLQGSMAARQSLLSQYYTRLAREAAEAGIEYSESCINKLSTSWTDASPLKPDTDCSGAAAGGKTYVGAGAGWQSTFTVLELEQRDDGATVTESVGTTRLSGGRTYTQTVKKNVNGKGFFQITARQIVNGGWGNGHVGVLGSDNQLYGLGVNSSGELGDGTTTDRRALVRFALPGNLTVRKVGFTGVGTNFSTVIASDNQVYSSGSNAAGVLGNGTYDTQITPVKFNLPAGLTAKEVVVGGLGWDVMYVLASDNQVYGAGSNNFGQLGMANGDRSNKATPVKFTLPPGLTARSVATGGDNTYVLASDNNVYAVGRNDAGQLGIGNNTNPTLTPTKMVLPYGVTAKSIAASYHDAGFAYVLGSDDQVYGAGYNANGQLGTGNTANQWSAVNKFVLPTGLVAMNILPGQQTGCVVASNYQLYCAGRNNYGQLGIGNTTNQTTPQRFQLPAGRSLKKITTDTNQVENGPNTSIWDTISVIADDGQVYSAGKNDVGQVGNGGSGNQLTPARMQIASGLRAVKLTQGNESLYAITSDGKLAATGWNNTYQLGDGTTTNRTTPVALRLAYAPIDARLAQAVFSYANMTQVLTSDNQVYSAGHNGYGQMGIGNLNSPQPTPVRFQIPDGIFAVGMTGSDSNRHVIASDGQVYVAGYNNYGQVGQWTQSNYISNPLKFGLPAGVTAEKAVFGIYSTAALGSDHKAYISGYNGKGQLGDGTTTAKSNPIVFGTNTTMPSVFVKDIVKPDGTYSGGNTYSDTFILTTDGRVFGAGSYDHGQLGNPNFAMTSAQTTPIEFILPQPSDTALPRTKAVKVVSQGSGMNTFVLASDNQVYGAGRAQWGQLGNNYKDNVRFRVAQRFQLPTGLTARDVTVAGYSTYVLASDNQVYAVGFNGSGQLGVGDTTYRQVPTRFQMPNGITVREMIGNQTSGYYNASTGESYSYTTMYVLGSDNQIYAAGANTAGQIGLGHTNSPITIPTRVPLPSGLTAITGSGGTAPGITDGTTNFAIIGSDWRVYNVGYNNVGQLGDGTTTNRSSATGGFTFILPLPQTQAITQFKF